MRYEMSVMNTIVRRRSTILIAARVVGCRRRGTHSGVFGRT
uniref:Uncharacterized protein n=1 Tax=Ascaris lumbricoides TaxID=6252 RepID=A0A0M3ICN4_ASCLU